MQSNEVCIITKSPLASLLLKRLGNQALNCEMDYYNWVSNLGMELGWGGIHCVLDLFSAMVSFGLVNVSDIDITQFSKREKKGTLG